MRRTLMKSKIHRATVTQANLDYVGSITIDVDLMEAADLLPNEKVQIVDNDNGARLETYVIPGERGSGVIGLNGAAARLVYPGDNVIIISYAEFEDAEARAHQPTVVFVDEDNAITTLGIEVAGVAEPTPKPAPVQHVGVGSASTHGAAGGAGVAEPTPRPESVEHVGVSASTHGAAGGAGVAEPTPKPAPVEHVAVSASSN